MLLMFAVMATAALSDIPARLYVQGKLTDKWGSPVPDGEYAFRIKVVAGAGILGTYDMTGGVKNGLFNFIFGDEALKTKNFSGGLISLEVSVRGPADTAYVQFPPQVVAGSPFALCSYSLRDGNVEAQGGATGGGVAGASVTGVNSVESLAPLIFGILASSEYGAYGQVDPAVYGYLARNIGGTYYGAYAYAAKAGAANIGLYSYAKEGSGIMAHGDSIGLRATNISGGPALSVGSGVFEISNSVATTHIGPIYDNRIDIAPIEFDMYLKHIGAVGIISFDENHTSFDVKNDLIKSDSLIFLSPRSGISGTQEVYLVNRVTTGPQNYFTVRLKNRLSTYDYAEVSFLIINPYTITMSIPGPAPSGPAGVSLPVPGGIPSGPGF